MGPAFVIAWKDLRERLRDRSAILIAVVVPLALAAIFSLTIGDAADRKVTLRYAVVDLDRGHVARTFVEDVLGGLQRRRVVELRTLRTRAEARALAHAGDVAAAFVVPAGFTASVQSQRPAAIDVIGDTNAPIGTLIAQSIARSFAGELSSIRVAVAAALAAGSRSTSAQLARRAAAVPAPIAIADASASRKELDPKSFYAAGMAVFFLFFTVQFGVSSLLEERREGTLARLLAAPIPRGAIVGGKALTSLLLGLVSMAALVAGTRLLLGAHWGSPVGVGLLVAAGVLAATGVMALVATLARTAEQAGYWQSIVALVLGMLGGSFFPVGQSGGVLADLSLLTPHAWFLRGLTDMAGGSSWTAALPSTLAMLVFALVAGSAAFLRLGSLVEP